MNTALYKDIYRKIFPDNKDKTEEQLKRDDDFWINCQVLTVVLAVLLTLALLYAPSTFNNFQKLSYDGVIISAVAFTFAGYAQCHILRAEINFELRMRAVIHEIKDWQP